MTVLPILLSLACAALCAWLALSRLAQREQRRVRRYLYAAGAGAAFGLIVVVIERAVLRATALSFDVKSSGAAGALMATFLLSAPLEEAAKVLVIWPLYRRRGLAGRRLGALYAILCAAGFAAVQALFGPRVPSNWLLDCLRAPLAVIAQVFCSAAWGFTLGAGRRGSRWFSSVWLAAVLLHGLFDHILWGRGPGYLAAVIPMLGFMAFGVAAGLRELDLAAPPLLGRFGEPPSLRQVRAALRPVDQPVKLRWVVAGSFITIGLVIVLSAASVFVGHRIGIDFELADEADVRSAGPLLLLGTAVLAAFPLAGYLIARASAANSVLEPALSTLCALLALVLLLSLTAPVGVLFALAVTPIAIGLSCGGAWFGSEH